jgi:mRNA-degrading endonuclease toxin of MazEF toxin-antitoxin module
MIKKLRPSLIISNDEQNKNTSDIIICPITSQNIADIKSFEMLLRPNDWNNLSKDSKILLNLIFTMNKEYRLQKPMGKLNPEELKTVEQKLKLVLDFSD